MRESLEIRWYKKSSFNGANDFRCSSRDDQDIICRSFAVHLMTDYNKSLDLFLISGDG